MTSEQENIWREEFENWIREEYYETELHTKFLEKDEDGKYKYAWIRSRYRGYLAARKKAQNEYDICQAVTKQHLKELDNLKDKLRRNNINWLELE